MKTIIAFIFYTIFIFQASWALDQSSIDQLKKEGLQVQMGELTGAGSKFSVIRLMGFVLPNGVLMKENCNEIVLKNNINPKISDIIKVKIEEVELTPSHFVGFIIK